MDAYGRLRPNTNIERCKCDTISDLVLVDLLTDNPIHCAACRCEVDPKRIGLTVPEAEAVARWLGVAGSLYRLWLDSGEYEQYAKQCLLDPKGQVNKMGLELACSMSMHFPTYLWYFRDTDDREPVACPVCGGALDSDVEWGVGVCDPCRVRI